MHLHMKTFSLSSTRIQYLLVRETCSVRMSVVNHASTKSVSYQHDEAIYTQTITDEEKVRS